MYSIGVDIGGMSIKVGLVSNGKILYSSRVKTERNPQKDLENLANLILTVIKENSLNESDILGIGIGCPGAVLPEKNLVEFLPNLGWYNVDVGKILGKFFNIPIRISNDANVAALGEAIYGAAKDYNDVIMFTLGTGVGGGIIINKKLYEGGSGKGAELGHMTLFAGGNDCTCGRKGCIETYVSATALIEQTKEAMNKDKNSLMWEFVNNDINNVDGRTAFECSKKGDKTACEVRDKYVFYLSESVLNMLNIFRPQAFILGGGVSAQGSYLTDRVKKYCEKFEYGYKFAPKTEIFTAKLGNDAGIIGAAALFN